MSLGTIMFGNWNGKPIEWYVLKKEGFGILITTINSIGSKKFDSKSSQWSSSSIRAFLNNDFWNYAFDDSEKRSVINVYLNDVDTKDNVFLLSHDKRDKSDKSDTSLSVFGSLSGFGSFRRLASQISPRNERWTRTPYYSDGVYLSDSSNREYDWVWRSYDTYPSLYLRKDVYKARKEEYERLRREKEEEERRLRREGTVRG